MYRNMAADLDRHITGNYGEDSVPADCDYCGEDGHGEVECPVLRKERRQAEADYEGPLRGE